MNLAEMKYSLNKDNLINYSSKKDIFLNQLKTKNGKNKYKRYLGSPIRYAGGKTLAVGMIVEMLPRHINRLISPFIGGGSVEVAIAKELNVPVYAFDIFDILANYWSVQIENPKLLYKKLSQFSPTRNGFKIIKETLKLHWEGKIKLGKIDLASLYFFNHNTSYGPHFLGSPSDICLNKEKYQKIIDKVKNFNAPLLQVRKKSFDDIIPYYNSDFLYCDPPYYLGTDSKMFVGMYPHRNFPIHHNGFDHKLLRDLLRQHKGGFILSYNDCDTIREWYKEFDMITPKWQYSFGQGDRRVGKNRLENNNGSYIKQSHELLIWRCPK